MKLLTLNTHSLIEPEYEAKREIFVEFIAKEQPDVFALQEVNQTASAPAMPIPLADYCPCSGNRILLKEDNHAAAVAQMLKLIPVSVIAYRSQYGSSNPSAITGAAIAATLVSTATAVIFCKIKEKMTKDTF